ncbi:MAG TPA: AMP-binding protein [Solirubrobacteraceae bacterium]|jgi:O-succinylbenzoic acid--CoA ligase
MLVEAWLQRAAATAPAATALRTPAGSCSYAELLVRARAGAAELRAVGVQPGDRVAIALPAGLDFAYTLHACLLLGAAAVPIDLRLRAEERSAIETGAAVVVEEPLAQAPSRTRHAGVRARGGVANVTHLADAGEEGGFMHDLDAVAAVIHTSGTTSAPKPIELTYGNFLWSALGSAVALGLDPAERWLCALPLAHVGGLSILLRSAIYASTAVVHPRFETEAVLDALLAEWDSEDSVTLVSLVATTLARLLDGGLRDPPALRCALTGGGPVPAALLARARAAAVPVSLTYGLTEACSQVTTTPLAALDSAAGAGRRHAAQMPPANSPPSADAAALTPSAGPPLFCTRVQIAADGEIELAGPTVARAAMGADGWLRTGDLGRLNAEGSLEVTGRKADTIVSGGENVAPAEVEAVLEAHPEVLEAAVLGRVDDRWGEAVAALVVLREQAAVDVEELRAHCVTRLAPYKVPKQVALVAGPLPRTRSGKLLRRELA